MVLLEYFVLIFPYSYFIDLSLFHIPIQQLIGDFNCHNVNFKFGFLNYSVMTLKISSIEVKPCAALTNPSSIMVRIPSLMAMLAISRVLERLIMASLIGSLTFNTSTIPNRPL